MTQPSQSIFDAASPAASLMEQVAWVLFGGGTALFLLVMFLVLRGASSDRQTIREARWIIGGGLALPIVVLSALFAYGLKVGAALAPESMRHGAHENSGIHGALHIRVTGNRWWWTVTYETAGDGEAVLANELHLPVGITAELTLTSADVIHSFWVPALAGKIDMIPGHQNRLLLRPDKAGVFRGQCAEYCGTQHARMALEVVVEPEADFRAWLERQRAPAVEPTSEMLRSGRQAFFAAGCAACHAIRGTEATGQLGPDLTHVGGRRTLGAGVLRNHRGAMYAWIANTQALKPGSLMPTMDVLDEVKLRSLSAYLESLE